MKRRETEFEVIDQYGERHRFKRSAGYWWAWRPKPGTADVDDSEFLDVFKHFEEGEDDDGEVTEVFAICHKPARVGNVTEDTCLSIPFRELHVEQCPRCGFMKRPNGRGERGRACATSARPMGSASA